MVNENNKDNRATVKLSERLTNKIKEYQLQYRINEGIELTYNQILERWYSLAALMERKEQ